jgi:hypothetical protein
MRTSFGHDESTVAWNANDNKAANDKCENVSGYGNDEPVGPFSEIPA